MVLVCLKSIFGIVMKYFLKRVVLLNKTVIVVSFQERRLVGQNGDRLKCTCPKLFTESFFVLNELPANCEKWEFFRNLMIWWLFSSDRVFSKLSGIPLKDIFPIWCKLEWPHLRYIIVFEKPGNNSVSRNLECKAFCVLLNW